MRPTIIVRNSVRPACATKPLAANTQGVPFAELKVGGGVYVRINRRPNLRRHKTVLNHKFELHRWCVEVWRVSCATGGAAPWSSRTRTMRLWGSRQWGGNVAGVAAQ